MTDLLPFLKDLISVPGLSGYEGPARQLIEDAWRPLTDELHASRLGSLHGLRKGTLPEPRPSILLATHMDAIGLMVTGIVDGFLRITEIGGIDHRVLPGQLVTVHATMGIDGSEELPGVVVQPPGFLLPPDLGSGPVPLEHLLVDTGLLPSEVSRKARVGDLVSFSQEPIEMGDSTLAGHTLDNRASVAALTDCLEQLKSRAHAWDVWAVATVQEEETLGGAFTSAFELRPSLAVAIDVTWAKGPGTPDHESFPMGKGITLGWGPNIHPGLYRSFKDVADRFEIPYQMEPAPRHTGTDAYALQIAREGIPTMVISIPLRYMHTPVEIISMKDVQRTGRLLAEFVAGLDEKFMAELKLDD
jgi:putative aminopeptidase FrvX